MLGPCSLEPVGQDTTLNPSWGVIFRKRFWKILSGIIHRGQPLLDFLKMQVLAKWIRCALNGEMCSGGFSHAEFLEETCWKVHAESLLTGITAFYRQGGVFRRPSEEMVSCCGDISGSSLSSHPGSLQNTNPLEYRHQDFSRSSKGPTGGSREMHQFQFEMAPTHAIYFLSKIHLWYPSFCKVICNFECKADIRSFQ